MWNDDTQMPYGLYPGRYPGPHPFTQAFQQGLQQKCAGALGLPQLSPALSGLPLPPSAGCLIMSSVGHQSYQGSSKATACSYKGPRSRVRPRRFFLQGQ